MGKIGPYTEEFHKQGYSGISTKIILKCEEPGGKSGEMTLFEFVGIRSDNSYQYLQVVEHESSTPGHDRCWFETMHQRTLTAQEYAIYVDSFGGVEDLPP